MKVCGVLVATVAGVCCQGKKLPLDCDMSEGYVTDEDETTDAEQLKKAGKRVRSVHMNVVSLHLFSDVSVSCHSFGTNIADIQQHRLVCLQIESVVKSST